LFVVVETLCPLSLFFGLGQGRQRQARQNGDDRNDDQQFNQRESRTRLHYRPSCPSNFQSFPTFFKRIRIPGEDEVDVKALLASSGHADWRNALKR
jgi:hypothetical protein